MAMIALGSAVAFAPLARAETSDAKPTRVAARKAGAHDRLQHIADVLQLTDDQKAKVKPIFQDEAQKMKALGQDTNLSKQDRMAKLKVIHQDTTAKIKPILTAEQLVKWNKLQEDSPRKHRKQ